MLPGKYYRVYLIWEKGHEWQIVKRDRTRPRIAPPIGTKNEPTTVATMLMMAGSVFLPLSTGVQLTSARPQLLQ